MMMYVTHRMAAEDDWDTGVGDSAIGGGVEDTSVEIKLFGKWSTDEVQVTDISLQVLHMNTYTFKGAPQTFKPPPP